MLAQHRTQKDWLDVSQGMGSYLAEMENLSRAVVRMSGRFEYAEGWRRHATLGFAAESADPLAQSLGARCWIDPTYEKSLAE